MAPPTARISVEEIPGNQYPSLEAAQRLAAADMAKALAATIRSMLASGLLAVDMGQLTLTGKGLSNA